MPFVGTWVLGQHEAGRDDPHAEGTLQMGKAATTQESAQQTSGPEGTGSSWTISAPASPRPSTGSRCGKRRGYTSCVRRIAVERYTPPTLTAWSTMSLQAIPTPRKPLDDLLSWRLRCFCSTMFKLYDRLLGVAAARSMSPLVMQQFSFARGRQGMDMSEALRCIVRRAHKWGHHFCMASSGADKAFDQVEAKSVLRAVVYHGAPTWGNAAVLREQ